MVSWEAERSGGDGDCSLSLRVVIVVDRGVSLEDQKARIRRLSLGMFAMHPRLSELEDLDEGG